VKIHHVRIEYSPSDNVSHPGQITIKGTTLNISVGEGSIDARYIAEKEPGRRAARIGRTRGRRRGERGERRGGRQGVEMGGER
jgi:hypothetical protein